MKPILKTLTLAFVLAILTGGAALACPKKLPKPKAIQQKPEKSPEQRFKGLIHSLPGLRMPKLLVEQKPAGCKPIA